MKEKSIGVAAIGYGLFLIYGVGLLVYLVAFVLSFYNQRIVVQSTLFTSEFKSIEEFQRHVVIWWVLYFPQLVGLYGVINLRGWGRRLVVAMNIIACFYVTCRMIFILQSVDSLSVASILVCVGVIAFLNWPKIKGQFSDEPLPTKKKILIVDDDRGLLKMVNTNLTSKGFKVFTASTGEQGIQIAQKKKPDLIILDVILPGIKGREICSRLKKDDSTKDIPVVFLTVKESPDDIQAEIKAGAIGHITKPLSPKELWLEVRKILGV